MNKVPIFKLEFDDDFRHAFQQGCEQIFNEGHLTNHTFVREVEDQFREKNGSLHTLAVNNGTAALEVALRAIDVKGKEVILPTNTFVATYAAIKNAGGIPVIADVENKFYALCPQDLKQKITNKTKAVIVVHIGGHISPAMKEIIQICQEKDLLLVEDAAHAHFAEFNGVKAGNLGDVGCFSFHMTKIITAGEGGMLTIKNRDLFDRARSIRQFGMDLDNSISHILDGSNFKLGEFNALILKLDLERASKRIKRRREIAKRYQERLRNTNWRCFMDTSETKGSYYKQVIIPPKNISREEIITKFQANDISLTGGVYYLPLHHQPICHDETQKSSYPNAEDFSLRHICPPCYPELEFLEVDRICDILLELSL